MAAMITRHENPRCPPNGLERAEWFRRQAAHHRVGGLWWLRLMATAIAIELRLQRDEAEPVMSFKDPITLLIEAETLRQAAADEDAPQAKAEMLAGAKVLEQMAMRGGHGVTSP